MSGGGRVWGGVGGVWGSKGCVWERGRVRGLVALLQYAVWCYQHAI